MDVIRIQARNDIDQLEKPFKRVHSSLVAWRARQLAQRVVALEEPGIHNNVPQQRYAIVHGSQETLSGQSIVSELEHVVLCIALRGGPESGRLVCSCSSGICRKYFTTAIDTLLMGLPSNGVCIHLDVLRESGVISGEVGFRLVHVFRELARAHPAPERVRHFDASTGLWAYKSHTRNLLYKELHPQKGLVGLHAIPHPQVLTSIPLVPKLSIHYGTLQRYANQVRY
jgi:hypothetical protein